MVYLVGAGPGDKGLITEKGKKCIENADVLVFDKLACGSLCELARDGCEFIYAGKEAGAHHLKQEEINAVLIQRALEGKNVVRLKGGDPFVFGRGGEEAQELRKRGIPFEIVCGVSSCYSVGAYAGIPVTHRDCASSFHVITGHGKNGKALPDFKALAALDGTLVFLMSLKNLAAICSGLIDGGKNEDTPCAVIQRGTTSKQKCAVGTLKTICGEAERAQIKTPALTIVGEAVKIRAELEWFGGGSLFGKSVMLTGTRGFNEKTGERLTEYGADVLAVSLIGTRAINREALDATDFSDFSWLVFTSAVGVKAFFDSIRRTRRDIRTLAGVKTAAVGRGTADALAEMGICADLIPDKNNGARLGELLAPMADGKVLIIRSSRAVRDIDAVLSDNGVEFEEISAYETYTRYEKKPVIEAYGADADYAVLASPSAVDAYSEIYTKGDIKIIAIGKTTGDYMRSAGIENFITADTPDADGIAAAIIKNEKEGTQK